MPYTIDELQWENLMARISSGNCTPFLGAGASTPTLKLGGQIAEAWAVKYKYPLEDRWDLARVAQFLAVKTDHVSVKDKIIREFFEGKQPPNFKEDYEPHGVLAGLPIPIFMTTNYDDFMIQALNEAGKSPMVEVCRWNKGVKEKLQDHPSVFTDGFEPKAENPVVFYLHGNTSLSNSLVLTEDDYLDFIINVSKSNDIIPPRIREAITDSSLLFIGYSLMDWNFRVLFRSLITTLDDRDRVVSFTVQVPKETKTSSLDQVQEYLKEYFENYKMDVYWGTAREFAKDLHDHWQDYSKPK